MSANRIASEQVAFRIEPELAEAWSRLVADSLIPNRAHLASAMLLYMGADAETRDAAQRAYARFHRTRQVERPRWEQQPSGLTPDERDLLEAYRQATATARDEAIADLQDRPESSSGNSGSGDTPAHRAG